MLVGGGCGSFQGPGIEFSAPRVEGRVLAAESGAPLRGVRVGRELHPDRHPLGGFWKGTEQLRLLQAETRTAKDGSFVLPAERVAYLFTLGDVGFNLRLVIQAANYQGWQTNYPLKALSTNAGPDEPLLDAGEIRLRRR